MYKIKSFLIPPIRLHSSPAKRLTSHFVSLIYIKFVLFQVVFVEILFVFMFLKQILVIFNRFNQTFFFYFCLVRPFHYNLRRLFFLKDLVAGEKHGLFAVLTHWAGEGKRAVGSSVSFAMANIQVVLCLGQRRLI